MRAEPFNDSLSGLRDYWLRPGVAHPQASRAQWLRVLVIFLLGLFCGAAIASAAAEPCVRVKVRPTVMLPMGKYTIDVEVRVLRHDDHRRLLIEWTRDGVHDGSSTRELAGASAPFLHTLGPMRDKPGAEYEFMATVYDQAGKTVGRDHARILAPSRDDE